MKKLRITVDGKVYEVTVESLEETGGTRSSSDLEARQAPLTEVTKLAPSAAPRATAGSGSVVSPLGGRVVSIDCALGQKVEDGATLITLEAMKMNTFIPATMSGTITEILVKAGDAVEEGQVLVNMA